MPKKTIIISVLIAVGVIYAFRMYNKKKTKIVTDESMEYEIDITKTTE